MKAFENMWKEFRIAVSFLTRLPLPYKGEWDEKAFSRSTIFYPFVGLIVGLIVALIGGLVMLTELTGLASVLCIITAIVVSGGIHCDGFMDTCDGIFASRGRERALEIMKDSRVGSFAVIGISLLFLLEYVLYDNILTMSGYIWFIIIAFVFSRMVMNCAILWFPSVRKEGLGYTVKQYVSTVAPLLGFVLIILLALLSGQFIITIIAFVLALIVMMGIAVLISRFLKGLSGDIYGALAELSVAVFLLILLIVKTVF